MATVIKLNGVDWTPYVADLATQPKESKAVKTNVRGGSTTISPRYTGTNVTVQLTFPYLTIAQMQAIKALSDAQVPVQFEHSFEFPQGTYTPIDFAKSVVKTLDQTCYQVLITLSLDLVPTLPIPPAKSDLSAGGIAVTLGL